MIPSQVVQVLDFVDPDNPVLRRERFLERVESGRLGGETGASDTILGLAGGEESVIVVVRHFVPVGMN